MLFGVGARRSALPTWSTTVYQSASIRGDRRPGMRLRLVYFLGEVIAKLPACCTGVVSGSLNLYDFR